MTGGHLFVVHGDLTRLACDDVCVPTDRNLDLRPQWRPLVPDPPAPDASWPRRRVLRAAGGGGRRVWLTDTGSASGEDIAWLLDGVREFLAAVRAELGESPRARNGRLRPLVGLPVVGVGAGGYQHRRGEVVAALLEALQDDVERAPYDLALVCASRSDFAAAQHLRRTGGLGRWDLDERLLGEADRLAGHAVQGSLVPFVGAGLGAGAGLPGWSELLAALARGSSLAAAGTSLGGLPAQDAALLLQQELGQEEFGRRLQELLPGEQYALAHGLLAGLRCAEAVTTNYDTLLEAATEPTLREGEQLRVLPWQQAEAPHRWLLKLHGDVARVASIVLSREDYLRYDTDRRPLAAMVQGLLMTRHVLFVGFSLADDNVIRLAHEVRDVLRHTGESEPVGTALSLRADPLRARLWEQALRFVPMVDDDTGDAAEGAPGRAAAARRLEVFLDRLAFGAALDASFLLDDRYAGLTEETGDQSVAEALRALVPLVTEGADDDECLGAPPFRADPIRGRVARLLADLGWQAGRTD